MPISASHWLLAGALALAVHLAIAMVLLTPLAGGGGPAGGGGTAGVRLILGDGSSAGAAGEVAPPVRET
ncbi:MAG: hypothetical protein KDC18_10080, partial [Alphaproteobacteria bacterium]|nr:hypothetical protein [Alphaproteobacteria bacterium]